MRAKSISLLFAFFLLLSGSWSTLPLWAYVGPPPPSPAVRSEPDPRFIQYTLPAGSAFQVLLQSPLDTSINQAQDPVEAIMDHNLYLGEELILPKNTRFKGMVAQLDPPIQGRNGILRVIFTDMFLNNGEILPITAHVRTERPDHQWGGEATRGTKPVLSTQRVMGIGEYNRVVYAGPRAMGQHIKIPPGEHWIIILDQPLTILKPKEE